MYYSKLCTNENAPLNNMNKAFIFVDSASSPNEAVADSRRFPSPVKNELESGVKYESGLER